MSAPPLEQVENDPRPASAPLVRSVEPDAGQVGAWRWAGVRLFRAALPAVAVATLIPLALFYVVLAAGSMFWAIAVSVVYAYGFAGFQYSRSRRVSGMLMMTVLMVTLRAVAAAASGQALVYFAIPVAETVVFALLFVATMSTSEPLIVRLARDLVPHVADDLAGRRSLVRGLSFIWMATYLASGATTLALLTTVSLPVYMGAHQIAGWCWVGGGTRPVCRPLSAPRRRAPAGGAVSPRACVPARIKHAAGGGSSVRTPIPTRPEQSQKPPATQSGPLVTWRHVAGVNAGRQGRFHRVVSSAPPSESAGALKGSVVQICPRLTPTSPVSPKRGRHRRDLSDSCSTLRAR